MGCKAFGLVGVWDLIGFFVAALGALRQAVGWLWVSAFQVDFLGSFFGQAGG